MSFLSAAEMSFLTLALTVYSTISLSKPFILLSLLLEIKHLAILQNYQEEELFCCCFLVFCK